MPDHPYRSLPDIAFWRRSVAALRPIDVDPVGNFDLSISREDRVATAGSCFAQHIARYLAKSGYHYFVTELGHPVLPLKVRQDHGYGLFSARFGNIYTARQLWQLMQRAYGQFTPSDDCWTNNAGAIVDPFRPTVQPGGFVSEEEMRADRALHLAAVRRMFEELDVFVFTLGLTECWLSRADGAVYPLCPGVEAGVFDGSRYMFHNETVDEVVASMTAFIERLKVINPAARIVLTVSPVPLAATARAGQHVLTATSYSKAVLRVAAETLVGQHDDVHYFPSFEVITGNFNRGTYYADNLRDVVEKGVKHVMRLFMAHATDASTSTPAAMAPDNVAPEAIRQISEVIAVECDEVALDRD